MPGPWSRMAARPCRRRCSTRPHRRRAVATARSASDCAPGGSAAAGRLAPSLGWPSTAARCGRLPPRSAPAGRRPRRGSSLPMWSSRLASRISSTRPVELAEVAARSRACAPRWPTARRDRWRCAAVPAASATRGWHWRAASGAPSTSASMRSAAWLKVAATAATSSRALDGNAPVERAGAPGLDTAAQALQPPGQPATIGRPRRRPQRRSKAAGFSTTSSARRIGRPLVCGWCRLLCSAQPGHHHQERGLAAARWADDDDEAAGADRHRDVLQGGHRALAARISVAQARDLNRGFGRFDRARS